MRTENFLTWFDNVEQQNITAFFKDELFFQNQKRNHSSCSVDSSWIISILMFDEGIKKNSRWKNLTLFEFSDIITTCWRWAFIFTNYLLYYFKTCFDGQCVDLIPAKKLKVVSSIILHIGWFENKSIGNF